jgi:hypothetical protein
MIYLKKFTGMEADFRFIGNRPIVVDLSAAVLISPEAILQGSIGVLQDDREELETFCP